MSSIKVNYGLRYLHTLWKNHLCELIFPSFLCLTASIKLIRLPVRNSYSRPKSHDVTWKTCSMLFGTFSRGTSSSMISLMFRILNFLSLSSSMKPFWTRISSSRKFFSRANYLKLSGILS